MFTITESDSKLTAEQVFDQQVPNNFWIVTSFIIPKKYKDSDWWVVLFKNKKDEIVEGFKVVIKSLVVQLVLYKRFCFRLHYF